MVRRKGPALHNRKLRKTVKKITNAFFRDAFRTLPNIPEDFFVKIGTGQNSLCKTNTLQISGRVLTQLTLLVQSQQQKRYRKM